MMTNDSIYNLLTAITLQAREDIETRHDYTMVLTDKKSIKKAFKAYHADKENKKTAHEWMAYMHDMICS